MFAPQGAPQDLDSFRPIIVLAAIISVVFWRAVLKTILMIVAIILVVLLTSGAVLVFQSAHHVIR